MRLPFFTIFGSACDPLLSILFPQNCSVCGGAVESHSLGVACHACWRSTRFFDGEGSVCRKCGAFFGEHSGSGEAATCGSCAEHYYDRARAAGIYEGANRAEILRLKIAPTISNSLKSHILAAFRSSQFEADLLIPVPLSKNREIERGFNQAAVIARFLSSRTGIEIDEASLARTLHAPMHRAAMDRRGRGLSVQKAFSVKRPKLIEGRKVVLVDDVFTTGATASGCAAVLKKNGAASVSVFTIARAV